MIFVILTTKNIYNAYKINLTYIMRNDKHSYQACNAKNAVLNVMRMKNNKLKLNCR